VHETLASKGFEIIETVPVNSKRKNMFTGLDHIAIIVANTDEALLVFRDRLKLPVLFTEVLEEQGVRLTHLNLGNCHLQLVEPLWQDHPLRKALQTGKTQLHHLCLKVDNVSDALQELPANGVAMRDITPRRGPHQRKAAFIDPAATGDVLIEITSE
jgi:methylmalonyl-CoA/ethylmalonyl-CoA epimerase